MMLSYSPQFPTPQEGAFTFSGDDNTGMFRPAADTLAFSLGGAERLRLQGPSIQGTQSKVLTHTSATNFVDIAVASNTSVGGSIEYTIITTNGSNHQQIESGEVFFSAINEGGTLAQNIGAVGTPVQTVHTATTTTNVFTVTAGTNLIHVLCQSTSTLSGTPVPVILYRVHINSGSSTVTPI